MRKTIVIVAIAIIVGLAVPAAMAHTEHEEEACSEQHGNHCTPEGNHHACTGVRDWHESGQSESDTRSITIENTIHEVQAYVETDWDLDELGDELPLTTPGTIYIETNGFSGLQKSDWYCKSHTHDEVGSNEWVSHPDQVLL